MKKSCLFAIVLALFVFIYLLLFQPASQADIDASLEQMVIDSCLYESSINVSRYKVTPADLESLFNSLRITGQLPWYTDSTFAYRLNETTGFVSEFTPKSLYQKDKDKLTYEQKVAEILDDCIYEGMSEYQIALSIHDYLIVNACYDESLTKSTGYEFLVNGSSVCAGYAAAYQDLLNRAGINCVYVTSASMAHAWNLVNIDGAWYHVDVTWDDPVPDNCGYVSHTYFLLTDEEISSGTEPHFGWDSDISCNDTRFANAYWRDVTSRICFSNSEICYLLRTNDWKNCIYKRNETSGEEVLLYSEKKFPINIGAGNYIYMHHGLSNWNGRLYFNSMDSLLSIMPDGSDVRIEHAFDAKSSRKFLQGSFVENDTAQLTLSDHAGNTKKTTITLADSDYHKHTYKKNIIEPTHSEMGYSLNVCDCGLSFKSNIVKPTVISYLATGQKMFSYNLTEVFGSLRSILEQKQPLVEEWLSDSTHVVFLIAICVACLFLLRKKR